MRTERSSGFTLIEVLVTLALFSIIAALGLFVGMDAYRGSTLDGERDTVVSLLDRARTHAMDNRYALPHGLCLDAAGDYVVFRGSYDASTIEESSPKSSAVAISGIPGCGEGGIIFSQFSGTTTGGTSTLTEGTKSSTISVNEEGAILW